MDEPSDPVLNQRTGFFKADQAVAEDFIGSGWHTL